MFYLTTHSTHGDRHIVKDNVELWNAEIKPQLFTFFIYLFIGVFVCLSLVCLFIDFIY